MVAKYADWWNITAGTPEGYAHKLAVLRGHCRAVGRVYDQIVKTWAGEAVAVATTESEARRIAEASPHKSDPIVGTPEQVAEQVQAFIAASNDQSKAADCGAGAADAAAGEWTSAHEYITTLPVTTNPGGPGMARAHLAHLEASRVGGVQYRHSDVAVAAARQGPLRASARTLAHSRRTRYR